VLFWTTVGVVLALALAIIAGAAGVVFPWDGRWSWYYALGTVFTAYYASTFIVLYKRNSMRRLFRDRLTYGMATQLQKEEGELAEQAVGGQLDLPS
jgi:hypothetical protein